jgi:hypothetical protein
MDADYVSSGLNTVGFSRRLQGSSDVADNILLSNMLGSNILWKNFICFLRHAFCLEYEVERNRCLHIALGRNWGQRKSLGEGESIRERAKVRFFYCEAWPSVFRTRVRCMRGVSFSIPTCRRSNVVPSVPTLENLWCGIAHLVFWLVHGKFHPVADVRLQPCKVAV